MTTSDSTPARFRSATEFPKTTENLSHSDANNLYVEMRECLIFTNRSRGQLLRRNEEHKQSILQLQTNKQRLQTLINQLTLEKQQLIQDKQGIVSELEREINSMTTHLDRLSAAFEPIAEDLETPAQVFSSFWHLPKRFLDFIRTAREIVLSWREDRDGDTGAIEAVNSSPPQLPGTNKIDIDSDRKDRPQLYTDPASINRDLLGR